MAHFMFYAGVAYESKMNKQAAQSILQGKKTTHTLQYQNYPHLVHIANSNPVSDAVQKGYQQEMSDRIFAKHSAYSYEDLPSDRFGADFGANHFDPNSKLTFGEQLGKYLDGLGATDPKNAPNYNDMPASDAEMGETPSQTNHTTKPMHTTQSGEKGTMKHATEKDPIR